MKITYDKQADAAYIYLLENDHIVSGWVKKTYPCDSTELTAMINLDFDNDDKLGGIEVLDASMILPKGLLDKAEIIG